MAGFTSSNRIHPINQWYKLFQDQHKTRSIQAHTHWKCVEQLGLPNHKNENWKYIPLEELLAHDFISAVNHKISLLQANILSLNIDTYKLVFVNGRLSFTLSHKNIGPWIIEVERDAKRQKLPDPIKPEVFLHLNESLSYETTNIILPTGKQSNKPLYLLHISQGDIDPKILITSHYRHHVEIDIHAHGQIIEHFVSMNKNGHFSGSRMSIIVNNHATLNHIKLAFENNSSYHIGHNDFHISAHAIVQSNFFMINGAKFTRHQTSAQLNKEGSNLSINSLMLPVNQDISNIQTYVEHNNTGYSISRQLHKIIVDDSGKGIFKGLIKVDRKAIQADGKMINNNLLLNKLAEVNIQPQLEIYADDVKCSHGATVGCIYKKQIFYLNSRGIPHKQALQMIINGFVNEIIQTVDNDILRDTIITRVTNVYKGRLNDISYSTN